MDAWDDLRTPCHSALKVYHRMQVVAAAFVATQMVIRHWGVPKGSRANTSSGIRGGEDVITKATHTLWRVALRYYNRHAMARLPKNPNKNLRSRTDDAEKCEQSRTPVSTANDTRRLFL